MYSKVVSRRLNTGDSRNNFFKIKGASNPSHFTKVLMAEVWNDQTGVNQVENDP
jgi:hypothetical protein